jgi:Tfp pilus assembly protein PilX
MQQEQRAGMKRDRKTHRRSQDGIALLIAIFVLLLISVVAIALLVSSGTETALGTNYRTSSTVYYAAIAGLEEARGRLLPKNPNYFDNSDPTFIPASPAPLQLGQTRYAINRSLGDNIVPWDSSNTYYDNEYQTEFGTAASSASWQSVNSVWDNNTQGIPGPIFKWVRINAATEQSLFLQVNASGSYNNSTPIYYDPFHLDHSLNPWPSLVVGSTLTSVQALEITALAELPNGTQKTLQYLVAPVALNLTFPAALTLDGYSDSFTGPNHTLFHINGNDTGDSACGAAGFPADVPAIWVPDLSDVSTVISGIPPGKQANYTGSTSSPSVTNLSGSLPALPASLQTPQGLDSYIESFAPYADIRLAGPADQTSLPAAMSSANPMSVFVQGPFTLTGGFNGYGLLIVTGNFTYTSDSSWNGIVMVVGQGTVSANSSLTGGTFNGAMFVAQTRNSSGNLLPGPGLGSATFSNTGHGNGILYNCGWINAAEATMTYKILSFHEIRQ